MGLGIRQTLKTPALLSPPYILGGPDRGHGALGRMETLVRGRSSLEEVRLEEVAGGGREGSAPAFSIVCVRVCVHMHACTRVHAVMSSSL